MHHNHGPAALDLRLMRELPTGLALFDERGALQDANPVFLEAAALASGQSQGCNFASLFGRPPTAFANSRSEAISIGGRHQAVSTKWVDGWGWFCQLQDVTAWVDARVAADETAARDGLTGLPNRAAMLPEIERAAADRLRQAALMMIDLDRFKAVNDTLGHPVGDALLCKVADRLSASLRATDKVARLGGDEFAVLQVGSDQPAGAETTAKRLVEVLSRPYVIEGHMIDIGASIGIATPSDKSLNGTATRCV